MAADQAMDFTAYDSYIDEYFDDMVQELRLFCSTPTLAGQRIGLVEGVAAVRTLLEDIGQYKGRPCRRWRATCCAGRSRVGR